MRSQFIVSAVLSALAAISSPTDARQGSEVGVGGDLATTAFTALGDADTYPTENCNGAVLVVPKPGTQFLDELDASPDANVSSIFRKAAERKVIWLSTMSCSRTQLTHRVRPEALDSTNPAVKNANQINTTEYSTNWAGYQIGNGGEYVQGGWQIPTVSPVGRPTYSTIGYSSSTWVGRGGGFASSVPLVQAGSTQHMSPSDVPDYYLWYEVYGSGPYVVGETKINNLRAIPGDDIGVFVRWHPSLGQSEMVICNFNVNTCADFYVTTPEPGNSMEWVVEAPSPGYGSYPIANYNFVRFHDACWAQVYATATQCQPITGAGVTSPRSILMRKSFFGFLQVVSFPQSITSNGLYVYYQHPVKPN